MAFETELTQNYSKIQEYNIAYTPSGLTLLFHQNESATNLLPLIIVALWYFFDIIRLSLCNIFAHKTYKIFNIQPFERESD